LSSLSWFICYHRLREFTVFNCVGYCGGDCPSPIKKWRISEREKNPLKFFNSKHKNFYSHSIKKKIMKISTTSQMNKT
jgi:hypothetical protein